MVSVGPSLGVQGHGQAEHICIVNNLCIVYIVDLKATTCILLKLFLFRCVNPAALPLVRATRFAFPGG